MPCVLKADYVTRCCSSFCVVPAIELCFPGLPVFLRPIYAHMQTIAQIPLSDGHSGFLFDQAKGIVIT